MPDTANQSPRERGFRRAPPIATFVREFAMPDGRPLIIDKRSIAFAVAEKDHPNEWTVIGFRTKAHPCPITTPIAEIKRWWLDEDRSAGMPKNDIAPDDSATYSTALRAPAAVDLPGSPERPPAPVQSQQDGLSKNGLGKKLNSDEIARRQAALAAAGGTR